MKVRGAVDIDSYMNLGETRFSKPTSQLHRNLDKFLGGVRLTGQADLTANSHNWTLTTPNPDSFSGSVRSWQHGNVMLAHCVGDGVTFHRTQQHVGDAGDQYLQIALVNRGEVRSVQRTANITMGPDSIFTLLMDEEFVFRTNDEMDIVLFHISRAYLESRGVNTGLMAGADMKAAAIVEPIRAMVGWAFELQMREDYAPRGYIERALLELLTCISTDFADGFSNMDDPSIATRAQVLSIIESRYSDPKTSVASIAQSLGFSTRQIYRLFQGREVSLAKMIKQRRLDRAEHMLRLPTRNTMAHIAQVSGFGGADQLSRAFRERHGISPLDYRTGIQERRDARM